MGKTSQEWWDVVKKDPELFNDWLKRQYRGEASAASRILDVSRQYEYKPVAKQTLQLIASQEEMHAEWVGDLLRARGITPDPQSEAAEQRYWATVKKSIQNYDTAMAVAAHAEGMRLERIRVICNDPETPEDVRAVFQKILVDEVFHEAAFRNLAGESAMELTRGDHEEGRRILGLEV